MQTEAEKECCPRFDPGPWDGTLLQWKDRAFVKDRVRSLFHVPLNYGAVMARNLAAIESAGVQVKPRLILTDENSLWGADVYFEVSGPVAGRPLEHLSGTFLSRVFEGPFSQIRTWVGEMTAFVEGRGRAIDRLYFFYTTCPACAKKYGRNYVVLLAKLRETGRAGG